MANAFESSTCQIDEVEKITRLGTPCNLPHPPLVIMPDEFYTPPTFLVPDIGPITCPVVMTVPDGLGGHTQVQVADGLGGYTNYTHQVDNQGHSVVEGCNDGGFDSGSPCDETGNTGDGDPCSCDASNCVASVGCTFTATISSANATLNGAHTIKPRGSCFWSNDFNAAKSVYIKRRNDHKWVLVARDIAGNCNLVFTAPDDGVATCPPVVGWTRDVTCTTCGSMGSAAVAVTKDCTGSLSIPCSFCRKTGGTTDNSQVLDLSQVFTDSGSPQTFTFVYESYTRQARFKITDRLGNVLYDSGCGATNGEVTASITVSDMQNPLVVSVDDGCSGPEGPWYWRFVCGDTTSACDATCEKNCQYTVPSITGLGGVTGPLVLKPRGNCFWSTDGLPLATIKKLAGNVWELGVSAAEGGGCRVVWHAVDGGSGCPPLTTASWTLFSNTCGGTPVLASNFTQDCTGTDPTPTCTIFEKAGGGDEGYSRTFDVSAAFTGGHDSAFFDLLYDTFVVADRLKIYANGQSYLDPTVIPAIFDSGCVGTAGQTAGQLLIGSSQSPIRVVIDANCTGPSTTAWYWRLACSFPLPNCCDCDFDVTYSGIGTVPGGTTTRMKYRGDCVWSSDPFTNNCGGIDRQVSQILRYFGGKWTLTLADGCGVAIWDTATDLSGTCPPVAGGSWTNVLNQFGGSPSFTLVEVTPCIGQSCGTKAGGGDEGYNSSVDLTGSFPLGQTTWNFPLRWNSFNKNSRLVVKANDGTTLYDSGCSATVSEQLVPLTTTTAQQPLQVKVTAGCTGQTGTQWHWRIDCESGYTCYWTFQSVYTCGVGWGTVGTVGSPTCSNTPPAGLNTWVKTATGSGNCTYRYVKAGSSNCFPSLGCGDSPPPASPTTPGGSPGDCTACTAGEPCTACGSCGFSSTSTLQVSWAMAVTPPVGSCCEGVHSGTRTLTFLDNDGTLARWKYGSFTEPETMVCGDMIATYNCGSGQWTVLLSLGGLDTVGWTGAASGCSGGTIGSPFGATLSFCSENPSGSASILVQNNFDADGVLCNCPSLGDELCDVATVTVSGGTGFWAPFNGTYVCTRNTGGAGPVGYHGGGGSDPDDYVLNITCTSSGTVLQFDGPSGCSMRFLGPKYLVQGPPASVYTFVTGGGPCTGTADAAVSLTRSSCPP